MKRTVTGCPVEVAMQILGGRWRAVLVYYLLDGPKRFRDLRRDVPRISQRMLTLDLRELERSKLVRRTIYPEVPVRVEYELTSEGRELRGIIHELCLWGKRLQRKPISIATRAKADDQRHDGQQTHSKRAEPSGPTRTGR